MKNIGKKRERERDRFWRSNKAKNRESLEVATWGKENNWKVKAEGYILLT